MGDLSNIMQQQYGLHCCTPEVQFVVILQHQIGREFKVLDES